MSQPPGGLVNKSGFAPQPQAMATERIQMSRYTEPIYPEHSNYFHSTCPQPFAQNWQQQ